MRKICLTQVLLPLHNTFSTILIMQTQQRGQLSRPKINSNVEHHKMPGTDTEVIVTTRRDQLTNVLVSQDCEIQIITNALENVKKHCLAKIRCDEEKRYNLVYNLQGEAEIHEIGKSNDNWDFDNAEVIKLLTKEEKQPLCDFVVTAWSELLNQMLSYFVTSDVRRTNSRVTSNEEFSRFTRVAGNCKIKYIKELAELYFVMDRQTYFDVIGHFLLAGSHTFNTLYSIVSLQFTHLKGSIRGHISLPNASSRHITNTKTEFHTVGGVTIVFGRSTTIYMPRLRKRPVTDLSAFEPVVIHADAEVENPLLLTDHREDENDSTPAPRPPSPAVNVRSRTYERHIAYRILNFDGSQRAIEFAQSFYDISVSAGLHDEIGTLNTTNDRDFIALLEMFESDPFTPLVNEMLPYLNNRLNQSKIVDKFKGDDAFSSPEKREHLGTRFFLLLGLVDTPENVLEDLIAYKISQSNEMSVIMSLVINAVQQIG